MRKLVQILGFISLYDRTKKSMVDFHLSTALACGVEESHLTNTEGLHYIMLLYTYRSLLIVMEHTGRDHASGPHVFSMPRFFPWLGVYGACSERTDTLFPIFEQNVKT